MNGEVARQSRAGVWGAALVLQTVDQSPPWVGPGGVAIDAQGVTTVAWQRITGAGTSVVAIRARPGHGFGARVVLGAQPMPRHRDRPRLGRRPGRRWPGARGGVEGAALQGHLRRQHLLHEQGRPLGRPLRVTAATDGPRVGLSNTDGLVAWLAAPGLRARAAVG